MKKNQESLLHLGKNSEILWHFNPDPLPLFPSKLKLDGVRLEDRYPSSSSSSQEIWNLPRSVRLPALLMSPAPHYRGSILGQCSQESRLPSSTQYPFIGQRLHLRCSMMKILGLQSPSPQVNCRVQILCQGKQAATPAQHPVRKHRYHFEGSGFLSLAPEKCLRYSTQGERQEIEGSKAIPKGTGYIQNRVCGTKPTMQIMEQSN